LNNAAFVEVLWDDTPRGNVTRDFLYLKGQEQFGTLIAYHVKEKQSSVASQQSLVRKQRSEQQS
jgi:hypothetical protein